MKYTLLYFSLAVGMLTITSCSSDDDAPIVPETLEASSEESSEPVSWLANAFTPQALKEVEDAVNAVRGAGYTYRDNESYCVGTDMEVFNMRTLRDMEKKYNTSYITDDYIPTTYQKFFYSTSTEELKDQLSLDIGLGFSAGVFSVDVEVGFNKKSFSSKSNYYSLKRMRQSYFSRDLNYLNLREQVTNAIAASPAANTYPSMDADSLAKVVPFFKEAYSPGFAQVMQKFIRKIHGTTTGSEAIGICSEFIEEVGSGFVTRSVLGCSLDYYNTTSRDSVSKSLDVKVALEMAVQNQHLHQYRLSGSSREVQPQLYEPYHCPWRQRGTRHGLHHRPAGHVRRGDIAEVAEVRDAQGCRPHRHPLSAHLRGYLRCQDAQYPEELYGEIAGQLQQQLTSKT